MLILAGIGIGALDALLLLDSFGREPCRPRQLALCLRHRTARPQPQGSARIGLQPRQFIAIGVQAAGVQPHISRLATLVAPQHHRRCTQRVEFHRDAQPDVAGSVLRQGAGGVLLMHALLNRDDRAFTQIG